MCSLAEPKQMLALLLPPSLWVVGGGWRVSLENTQHTANRVCPVTKGPVHLFLTLWENGTNLKTNTA